MFFFHEQCGFIRNYRMGALLKKVGLTLPWLLQNQEWSNLGVRLKLGLG